VNLQKLTVKRNKALARIIQQPHQEVEVLSEIESDLEESPLRKNLEKQDTLTFSNDSLWNLDRLKTCLDDVIGDEFIKGVNQSVTHFGSPHGYLPLYKEDGDLGAISYLLQGEPRIWYGFLTKDHDRIIQFLQKNNPTEYSMCAEAHRHKKFFINPMELKKFFPDIKIFRAIQREGHYLITAPGVFYQGFNVGHNLSQSVNFGTPEWKNSCHLVKTCFCLSSTSWNITEFLKAKKKGNSEITTIEQLYGDIARPEHQEITRYADILNIPLNTKHFATYRTGSFAIITTATDYSFVQQELARIARHAGSNKVVLTPTDNQVFSHGNYVWEIYQPNRKLKTHQNLEQDIDQFFNNNNVNLYENNTRDSGFMVQNKKLKNNQGLEFFVPQERELFFRREIQEQFGSNTRCQTFAADFPGQGVEHFLNKETSRKSKKSKKSQPNFLDQGIAQLFDKEIEREEEEKSRSSSKVDSPLPQPRKASKRGEPKKKKEEIYQATNVKFNHMVERIRDYGSILQYCFILPTFTSSQPVPKLYLDSTLREEYLQTMNSFDLAEICSQLKGSNLENLYKVVRGVSLAREARTITNFGTTILYTHNQGNIELPYKFILVDEEGIIRINTSFGGSQKQRSEFWNDFVAPFLNFNSTLICPNLSTLCNLFLINKEILPCKVVKEVVPNCQDIDEIPGKIVTQMRNVFQNIDFARCSLEDLARFQRFYFKSDFLPYELHYIQGFCSLIVERSYLLTFHLRGKEWALCLIDSNGQGVTSRTSTDWGADLIESVRHLTEVIRHQDIIYYFGQEGLDLFTGLDQVRFLHNSQPFVLSTTLKTSKKLFDEGTSFLHTGAWENRA
jgi:hypothetical protein